MAGRKTYTIDATGYAGLNLREQPSMDSEVIKLLENGAKVIIDPEIEAPEGWVAIKDGGYVMSEYLK